MARTVDLERRADLATRAFEVIRARGVHRTTMSDLAAALGLKRPTLYFYFRDLGAVFEAVHEATQRAYLTHVTARLAGVAHPIDLLIAVLRSTSEFHRAERERIVALFQLWAVGGAARIQPALTSSSHACTAPDSARLNIQGRAFIEVPPRSKKEAV